MILFFRKNFEEIRLKIKLIKEQLYQSLLFYSFSLFFFFTIICSLWFFLSQFNKKKIIQSKISFQNKSNQQSTYNNNSKIVIRQCNNTINCIYDSNTLCYHSKIEKINDTLADDLIDHQRCDALFTLYFENNNIKNNLKKKVISETNKNNIKSNNIKKKETKKQIAKKINIENKKKEQNKKIEIKSKKNQIKEIKKITHKEKSNINNTPLTKNISSEVFIPEQKYSYLKNIEENKKINSNVKTVIIKNTEFSEKLLSKEISCENNINLLKNNFSDKKINFPGTNQETLYEENENQSTTKTEEFENGDESQQDEDDLNEYIIRLKKNIKQFPGKKIKIEITVILDKDIIQEIVFLEKKISLAYKMYITNILKTTIIPQKLWNKKLIINL